MGNEDKNAAILKKNNKEKKDAKETKTANHDVSKETEKTVEKKKKKKRRKRTKGKEIGGMTMDDKHFSMIHPIKIGKEGGRKIYVYQSCVLNVVFDGF